MLAEVCSEHLREGFLELTAEYDLLAKEAERKWLPNQCSDPKIDVHYNGGLSEVGPFERAGSLVSHPVWLLWEKLQK